LSDPKGSSLQLDSAKFEKTEQLSLLCAAMERMEYQKKQGRINSALTELIKKLAGRKLPYTEKDLVWNLRCAAIILAPKDPKKVQYEELDSPIPGVVPALLDQTEMLLREKPASTDLLEPLNQLHAALRQAGVPTFILSNTNDMAVGHIRRTFPFFSNFDAYIFSFEQNVMKPHAGIYEIAERITGHRAGDIVYIDDRAENLAPAALRNWQVIHHQSPDQTISALKTLGFEE